jgi:hypothetical protein
LTDRNAAATFSLRAPFPDARERFECMMSMRATRATPCAIPDALTSRKAVHHVAHFGGPSRTEGLAEHSARPVERKEACESR